MKYKIVPDDIVKNMIEFLDEVQFEAAKGKSPDDLHKINFCNWMISELMHSIDGFDSEDEANRDAGMVPDSEDTLDRWSMIDDYRKDMRMYFPDDMSDEEWHKLIQQFDSFIDGWDKAYKKDTHKKKGKKNSLERFSDQLRSDRDLTPSEKFELYYDEYDRRRKKSSSISLNKMLNHIGVTKRFNSKGK